VTEHSRHCIGSLTLTGGCLTVVAETVESNSPCAWRALGAADGSTSDHMNEDACHPRNYEGNGNEQKCFGN
jgi:hypothetical protein